MYLNNAAELAISLQSEGIATIKVDLFSASDNYYFLDLQLRTRFTFCKCEKTTKRAHD
jgi:hypothetical protein